MCCLHSPRLFYEKFRFVNFVNFRLMHTDLQALLNFMNHGEVNIAQEELNSFLAVEEDLRVKGLTQNQSSSQQITLHSPTEPTCPYASPVPSI